MQINERVFFFFPRWISVRRVHEQKSDYWENYYRDLYLSNNTDGDTVWRAWRLKKTPISSLFLKLFAELPSPMWLSTSFHNLDCQRPLDSRRVVQRICPAAHTRSLCCNFGELPPKSQKHRQDAFCSLHRNRRTNVWGAHFFFLLPALSHQWKGRADYTTGITLLSPRGRASTNKKKKTRLCGFPALPRRCLVNRKQADGVKVSFYGLHVRQWCRRVLRTRGWQKCMTIRWLIARADRAD